MWEEWTTIGYVCLMVLRGSIFHLATTQTVWFRKLYPFVGIYVTSTQLLLLIDPDFWGPKLNYGTAYVVLGHPWMCGDRILLCSTQMNIKLRVWGYLLLFPLPLLQKSSSWAAPQQSGTERRIVTESQWAVSFSSLHTWAHNTASPYPRPFHSINRINWDKRFSGHGSFAFPISIIILLVLVQGGCF